ncbi:hypothetical protein DPMN_064682 [Dreissena polymorpha]|uniref:MULE transposase domain-containing protein n=1 Tax=Dreissena polymorpha TaxID=45954 RepID=A0A9D4CDK8_DREPO|nr:hypothetical protein DPMN_064682 [Dreissena polymorpha]
MEHIRQHRNNFFAQLFCIRVPLGDGNVSAAYAFLTGKQQEFYEEVFTAVLDACLQRDIRPNVRVVVCDYEQAIHNAVRTSLSFQIRHYGTSSHVCRRTTPWPKQRCTGSNTGSR